MVSRATNNPDRPIGRIRTLLAHKIPTLADFSADQEQFLSLVAQFANAVIY